MDIPAAKLGVPTTAVVTFDIELKAGLNVSEITDENGKQQLVNKATVGPDTPSVTVEVDAPIVGIKKTVADSLPTGNVDGKIQPGEEFTYTIAVENKGNTTSYNTKIQDTLEQIIEYIDTPNALDLYVDGAVVGQVSSLLDGTLTLTVQPHTTMYITFTVRAKADLDTNKVVNEAGKPGRLSNRATGTNDYGDIPPTETYIDTVSPKLTLVKDVKDAGNDTYVQAGEEFTYTIKVTNGGNATSYRTQIEDKLNKIYGSIETPDAETVQVVSSGGNNNYPSTYTVADLMNGNIFFDIEANETVTLQFTVKAKADLVVAEGQTLDNTAYARTPLEEAKDDASIKLGSSTLITNKKADADTISQGEVITYTISATNDGTVKDNVNIKDPLTDLLDKIVDGDKLSKIRVDVTVGSTKTTSDLEVLSTTGIDVVLQAKQTVTVVFKVQSLPGFDVTGHEMLENTSNIHSENENKNYDPDVELQYERPALNITKEVVDSLPLKATDEAAQPGENLTYTIRAENTGNAISYGTIIRDELLNLKDHLKDGYATKEVKVTSNQPTSSNHGKSFKVSELMAGLEVVLQPKEMITLQFTVTVDEAFDADSKSEFINVVTIHNTDGQNDHDTAKIPTVMPKVVGYKAAETADGDKLIEQGEKISYTLTADNTEGTAVAYGVEIKDALTNVEKIMEEKVGQVNIVITGALKTEPKNITKLSSLKAGFLVDIPAGEVVTVTFTVTAKAGLDVSEVEEVEDETILLTNIATIGDSIPEEEKKKKKP